MKLSAVVTTSQVTAPPHLIISQILGFQNIHFLIGTKYIDCGTSIVGGKRNACRFLVWKPEEKGRLGRSGSRWENNIITDSKEINSKDVKWIHLVPGKNK